MTKIKIYSYKTRGILFSGEFENITICLERAIHEGVDLAYAALSHLNLSNANLDDAKMRYADLRGANLSGANLSESDLYGAQFEGASLYNTCLAWSDLSHSSFENSSFGATDITGCNLSCAVFSGQSCFSLDFVDAGPMAGCVFKGEGGDICPMSCPPIVIKGLAPRPLVFMNYILPEGGGLKIIQPEVNKKLDLSRLTI